MNTRDTYWKNSRDTKTYAFTPRIPELQALNGSQIQTLAAVNLDKIRAQLGDQVFSFIRWLFSANNLNLEQCILTGKVGEKNLGKWLTHSHIPEDVVSQICAAKTPGTTLTLTTRYKDFARMGRSKHYDSCFSSLHTPRSSSFKYFLHKPNVFLLIKRDPSGEFMTRIIGRVTRVKHFMDADALGVPFDSKVILLNNIYGVHVEIPSHINGIPCFQQPYKNSSRDYVYNPAISISDQLVRYEVGPERLGPDPGGAYEIWDDLLQRAYVLKPKK